MVRILRSSLAVLFAGLLILAVSRLGAVDKSKLTDMPVEKAYAGTVMKVMEHQCDVCKTIEVAVVLKTSKGKMEIKLGPRRFLETHAFLPAIGDELTVVGVQLSDNGKTALFANEIGKGGEHLILRGKFGRPEWLGPHGETCVKCGI